MRPLLPILAVLCLLAGCGDVAAVQVAPLPDEPIPRATDYDGLPDPESVRLFEATILWHATEQWNAELAEQAARKARAERQRAVQPPRARPAPSGQTAGSGRCGGDLPPCWVMQRESGGNIHAYNPTGCGGRGCYGKWQCDPRSCDGTGSEAEQDAEARRLWADGAGCSHWAAC